MENTRFFERNNLMLGLVIVGLVFWLAGVQRQPAVPEISVGDAATAIARGATVIDVRERHAYEKGHISGAVSVPLDELRRRAAEFAAAREKEYIIYCGNGSNLGPQGTRALTEAGHPATRNLPGGYSGWQAAGQPVASGAR
jgi:rhodanese-related sulfurtransferase